MNIINENKKSCIICNEMQADGIHLYKSFICINCEQSIVKTETEDPQYKFYVKKLKLVNNEQVYLK